MDATMIEIKLQGSRIGDYVVLGINNKPINPEFPLWQHKDNKETGKKTLRPVAFLLNKPASASLLVTVRILPCHTNDDLFLEGLYGTNNVRIFYGLPIEHLRLEQQALPASGLIHVKRFLRGSSLSVGPTALTSFVG